MKFINTALMHLFREIVEHNEWTHDMVKSAMRYEKNEMFP